ncbi:hypothetical protein [uncultured Veillonella sp.]|uniref:hypothetical protein n=1 Tax=uncultured Veillonella sp. TaxID=159268 RepID=UPI0025E55890|nr:hypothetical protein [uncultured Veillonella sp.]
MKTIKDYMRERDIKALNHVLSTELGRWFFCCLMDRSGILKQSFTGNSETYFNEGRRKVGLLFHGDLNKLGVDGVKQYHQAQLEYIGQQEYFNSLVEKEKQNG